MSAVELAARLRRKEVSARDVMTAHLQRIERVNPKVNAIVTLRGRDRAHGRAPTRADAALARGESRGPLHGLPVAHKDLVDTAGIRTTYGSPIYRDHVPDADALIVDADPRRRARSPSARPTRRSSVPGSQTFNPVFGATRNPYDLAKTCGGSSGGAAVALALRMRADRRRQRHRRIAAQPGRLLQRGRVPPVARPRAGRAGIAGRRSRRAGPMARTWRTWRCS